MKSSTLKIGRLRAGLEVRALFRDRQQLTFTFTLPLMLLLIFGSVFRSQIVPGVTFAEYFTAGIIASGVLYTSFLNLAITIPMEREDGTLKRLLGTPMPPASYFIGKGAQVVITYVAQVILLIAIGAGFFGVHIPTSLHAWLTFTWLSVLGLASCTLLGIAFSSVPRSAKSAGAMVTPIVLVLQFTSGVFFQFNTLPVWMKVFASFFPLKWLAQGMRSVFLPPNAASLQPGNSYHLGLVALILIAWTIAGLVLALRTFRFSSDI